MIALISVLSAIAVWLVVSKPPDARVERMFASVEASRSGLLSPWLGTACAALLGTGIAAVIGSPIGVAIGVGAAIGLHQLLGRLESRASRDRRIAIARQLPEAADLLVATLASGAPPSVACSAVAKAMEEPVSSMLSRVSAAHNLGATSAEAWAAADPHGTLSALSAAFIRSESSGAPIADVLAISAADVRRRHRREVEVAARSAGIRAVGPLAACFLPAFLLVGTMPVIASMAEVVLGR